MSNDTTIKTNAAGFPAATGLYDPKLDKDACGVGIIARMDGEAKHDIIVNATKILENLEHRGAIGGDKDTGDGAGIMMRIPDAFFRKHFAKNTKAALPPVGKYAVGMLFLPSDDELAEKCVEIISSITSREKCEILNWRNVPVNDNHLGGLARSTQPNIKQVFITSSAAGIEDFERRLYVLRRQIEKAVEKLPGDASQFYICSLSARTIVYKGLLTGRQLSPYFLDLADPMIASPYCLVHQRYSTNTLPSWALAQPFRYLAHNGEINTLKGNISQMKSREPNLSSELFGDDIEKIKPVLIESGSDSAIFDNMAELLLKAGRPLPHVMMMMIPEAWGSKFIMSADKRAFYEYYSGIMEPWDGPAAIMFCDDRYIGATLDRNGLRPARYTITDDGLLIMASETGVLDIEPGRIRGKGHLHPGKMFLLDLKQKRIIPDQEIKARISRNRPYRQWLKKQVIDVKGLYQPVGAPVVAGETLHKLHLAFGYTEEELNMVLTPMALKAQEPVGSMGNDTELPVFSDHPMLLYSYFKQLFAQVTNPPIDPLREDMVMSLMTWVGSDDNFLDEKALPKTRLKLNQPILTPDDLNRIRNSGISDLSMRKIDMLFDPANGPRALEKAMNRLFENAEDAISESCALLVLSDRHYDENKVPIPALLALAGLHRHLIEKGLRNRVGIIVESGEPREVGHFALLFGYGANAVCPYGAMATVASLIDDECVGRIGLKADHAVDHYITAVKKGLLKTLSRMGISTLRSYIGAQIFESIGLSRKLVDKYFTSTPSRIEGIGIEEIEAEALARHEKAFPKRGQKPKLLDAGGIYHWRHSGRRHLWTPEAICKLQHAVRTGNYDIFKQYTQIIDDQSKNRSTLRSLFEFDEGHSIPVEDVESVDSIVKRFSTAAMSFGSISPEAHETIAVAMNRLGAKSNSGEGGEDESRYKTRANGDRAISAVKQIASGRFGVTTDYLLHAEELQIKIAQGAKPGEGGQLPGHKVSVQIARVRHTTPGVTLISPPPHHDIYSIEDLAQLIYDLKNVNPKARVSVKLVSEVGVGAVAAGVAKAQADMVLISGHDGGTGASPLTSIMHAGAPWELGLAETQQSLIFNRLRGQLRVQVDGQLKTGRDLAVAALMGAEEFGFGTTVLVSLGCVMMRKCHLDTCPVGVATQNPELRKMFRGKPEHVMNFMRFMAREMRENMARLGFATVDEMVGRVDRLKAKTAVDHWKAKGLDMSAILLRPTHGPDTIRRCVKKEFTKVNSPIDDELIRYSGPAIEEGKKLCLHLPIKNIHRTVGARLSGAIVERCGPKGLPDATLQIRFTGSAGQSLGAFLAPGVDIKVEGDANDYVGKGMTGGRIIIKPHPESKFASHENTIIGNTALYGATGGQAYFSGIAGTRFAVRNSGATAVVEGVGRHGCEYMTGGIVVVLGQVGYNFAAGMSGGIAYVYDESQLFDTRCNLDMVELETVWTDADKTQIRRLVENHFRHTGSKRAEMMLENWEASLAMFVKVMPVEYKKALDRIRMEEELQEDTLSATEEVFDE